MEEGEELKPKALEPRREDAAAGRDWNIQEHGGSFSKYMEAKNEKLRVQFSRKQQQQQKQQEHLRRKEGGEEGSSFRLSRLFEGVCIHVNGYTVPSHQELKDIMAEYGGSFENYFSNTRVTHIICSNLTDAKLKQYSKERNPVPVVHPRWILECIRAGQVLPHSRYILDRIRTSPNQGTLQLHKRTNNTSSASVPSHSHGHSHSPRMKKEKDFVNSFFKNSRLHFIGSWKAKVEAVMSAAGEMKAPQPDKQSKIRQIIHVDIDCFFASVAIKENQALKGKPVAVCHSDYQNGTAEISSANYDARKFGIRAGMFFSKAKELCPDLVQVPYYFDKYQEISLTLYRILLQFSSCVQPVSIDEAFLDVSGLGDSLSICQNIRRRFNKETGISVSTGASHNMLLARMATKEAKPDGKFFIPHDKVDDIMQDLPVKEIPGVGYKLTRRLKEMNIHKCSDVWSHSKEKLQQAFGNRTGELIWEYAHGKDDRSVKSETKRQSVGAEVNWGIRFTSNQDAIDTLQSLSAEVERRLRQINTRGRSVTLKIKQRKPDAPPPQKYLGHGWCDNLSKSVTLASSTDDKKRIAEEAVRMLLAMQIDPSEIRGIGIQITKLDEVGMARDEPKVPAPMRTLAMPVNPKSASRKSGAASRKREIQIIDQDVWCQLPPEIQNEISRSFGSHLGVCRVSSYATRQAKQAKLDFSSGKENAGAEMEMEAAEEDLLDEEYVALKEGLDSCKFSFEVRDFVLSYLEKEENSKWEWLQKYALDSISNALDLVLRLLRAFRLMRKETCNIEWGKLEELEAKINEEITKSYGGTLIDF